MAVVGVDGALEVAPGHNLGIELRRVHHFVSALLHHHPLFAHVVADILHRDKEVLLAYSQKASSGYTQKAWKVCLHPIGVQILHGSYLLAVNVVDVEVADVLPRLLQANKRTAHFNGSFWEWRDPDSNRRHHDFQSC